MVKCKSYLIAWRHTCDVWTRRADTKKELISLVKKISAKYGKAVQGTIKIYKLIGTTYPGINNMDKLEILHKLGDG